MTISADEVHSYLIKQTSMKAHTGILYINTELGLNNLYAKGIVNLVCQELRWGYSLTYKGSTMIFNFHLEC